MLNLVKIVNTSNEIINKRSRISASLMECSKNIKSGTIKKIETEDLEILFSLYDEVFFNYSFKNKFRGEMKFSLSSRLTRSAGKTICPRNIANMKSEDVTIEIKIATDFLFHFSAIKDSTNVCGIPVYNSLEALQLVFEHELCHVIEFINFNESSCSKQRFKIIANNIFGHTKSYHELPTYRQIASERFGVKVGDEVSFLFEGKKLTGTLYNINKRATVMVKDKNGKYADRLGRKYSKYYVPVHLLRANELF
jgi:hypothetical protein